MDEAQTERLAAVDRYPDPSRRGRQIEVDFVADDMVVAVEAKATPRVRSDELNGLRQLKTDHPKVKERYVVSLESKPRVTEDGIVVLPWRTFVERLWGDELI